MVICKPFNSLGSDCTASSAQLAHRNLIERLLFMLFECCTSLRSDGWVWNVCGGGEEEISPSASSHEKQPLTLHFPQILWEESRTPREWQHGRHYYSDASWMGTAHGTMTGTIVPLALMSHLETYMEKKWLSAQQSCCLRDSSSLPPSCDIPAWQDEVGFPAFYQSVWCEASCFTLCVQNELGTEHDFWGPR